MGQSFCRKAAGFLTPLLSAPGFIAGVATDAPGAVHMRAIAPGNHRGARGVTLIELMVTLSVLATLAAVATPNLQSFLHNSRLSADATRLFADLELARSEAARRNATVTLCPVDAGNACSNNWTLRRILFVDADNDGAFDRTEELIRNSDPPQTSTDIAAANLGTTSNRVRMRSTGVSTAPNASWKFCGKNATDAGKTVFMTGSGRPYTQSQSTCP
ncbi:GspH/FimT family pseudopilin [Cupriavidus sp. SW-Y-13]|uniref:GspH/FimT family pseudopilin n=2 Tax=unclassified Cupriavidus TaxID=2640874 RepID=UPI0010F7C1A7|nr:GspH/FimT family pseudopilin [Cupriavidus sp. SW-Y-13]MWL88146.1 prepilin-type N-terminal cleavage/methylation domain-containing protein [Cupriavidus sp. SW-Y-13]